MKAANLFDVKLVQPNSLVARNLADELLLLLTLPPSNYLNFNFDAPKRFGFSAANLRFN